MAKWDAYQQGQKIVQNDLTNQGSQFALAEKKLAAASELLNGVSPENYSKRIQIGVNSGIIAPDDIKSGKVPQQYDPDWVNEMQAITSNTLSTFKLDREYKKAQINQMNAGGSTGVFMNRLQNEPDLKDAYFGKANAGKGIVIDDFGNPTIKPGYNEAVSSTKAAERQKEKNVDLQMNPKIEAKTKQAGLKAEYLEKGKQSLPQIQRSLQSKELTEEFIQPKVQEIADLARNAWSSTGFTGALTGAIPNTPAFRLKANVDTLLANAGFDALQEMRDNSPTGGALGQVTEVELALLQASAQNLLSSQGEEQFLKNLEDFRRKRIRSLQNVRTAYEQDYKRFGGIEDINLPSPRDMMEATSAQELAPYIEGNLSPQGAFRSTLEPVDPYEKARAAIAAGKSRAAVEKRLLENGLDPRGLNQ